MLEITENIENNLRPGFDLGSCHDSTAFIHVLYKNDKFAGVMSLCPTRSGALHVESLCRCGSEYSSGSGSESGNAVHETLGRYLVEGSVPIIKPTLFGIR
jgi:hypothetical protein